MSTNDLNDPTPTGPGHWDAEDALQQLQLRLQTAALLELYTIPLYLFSYYSIKNEDDAAAESLLTIVIQEMLHLALAGNILCAIGGDPQLYGLQYVPKYQAEIFFEKVKLNLAEPTESQIESFIRLEQPPEGQVHGLLDRYHTIHEFYADVEKGLKALHEKMGDSLFLPDRAKRQFSSGENMKVITDINSAMDALKLIVEQGEGGADGGKDSHYWQFKNMLGASIDCYPVVNNPVTSKYAGQKIHKVMLASDAALLARFLVTQPLEGPDEDKGKNAAPPFNRYNFELNASKSAFEQFTDLMSDVAVTYPNVEELQIANRAAKKLSDVSKL